MAQMSLTTTITLLALVTTAALLGSSPPLASAQAGAASSCTLSLLTSFTPCFSFLTNSSNGGAAPTRECCQSLAALMSASAGCACLVLTGAVPLPLPTLPPGLGGGLTINRTLAVSLPKACDMSVPLQCGDTSSAQSPPPGPAADTPSTTTPASPAATTPATPTVNPSATVPPASQGQTSRPTVVPSSARRATTNAHVGVAPAVAALLLAVAATLV